MTVIFVGILVAVVITVYFAITSLPQFGGTVSEEQYARFAPIPHFKKQRFVNLDSVKMNESATHGFRILRAFVHAPDHRRPAAPIPVVKPNFSAPVHPDKARITWFGHSSFLMEMDGLRLLVDPVFGPAASPFAFMAKRFPTIPEFDVDQLPTVDAVVISHDHYDHLDYPTIVKLRDRCDRFIVPLGVGAHLVRWGVDASKITELDWWQNTAVGTVRLTACPAQHFSGRKLGDRNSTLWAGWAFRGQTQNIFYTGDSGYSKTFSEIGERLGPFDLALIECGQYNELWEEIHMLPEQTAQCALDVRAAAMMPVHWGMFDLSLHTWKEPVERLLAAAGQHGTHVVTPLPGSSFDLSEGMPEARWWQQLE